MSSSGKRKYEIVAYLLLILTMVIWGGTWPIGKWIVDPLYGPTIPTFMIAAIRYFLAVVCFFIVLKVKEGTLNWQFAKKNWKILLLMGLLSVTVYQMGYLIGEIFTAASDASIMVATNAIWVVILSNLFLKTEFFNWKKIVGTLMAFIAVIIVFGFSPNEEVSNRLLGDVLILIAAVAYASYTVISRHFMNKVNDNHKLNQPSSLWIITWVSFFGFLTTVPLAFIIGPEYLNPIKYLTIPLRIWIGIIYLAFLSTIGAYTFYLEGVKRLSASRAAIFQTSVPLFGVVFSAIFLGEQFDVFIYPLSLSLVVLGITLVNLKSSKIKRNKSDTGARINNS
ncbi:MAG: DMT family transporter [Promethearchaeota archaeon]